MKGKSPAWETPFESRGRGHVWSLVGCAAIFGSKRIFICFEANKTGIICLFRIEANRRILHCTVTCEINKNGSEYSFLSEHFLKEPNFNWGIRLETGYPNNLKQYVDKYSLVFKYSLVCKYLLKCKIRFFAYIREYFEANICQYEKILS